MTRSRVFDKRVVVGGLATIVLATAVALRVRKKRIKETPSLGIYDSSLYSNHDTEYDFNTRPYHS